MIHWQSNSLETVKNVSMSCVCVQHSEDEELVSERHGAT